MHLRALLIAGAGSALFALSAQAAEKTYSVSGFSKVSVSAGIQTEISIGGAASARAEGTDEGIEKLEVFVEGDQLVLRRKPRSGFNWGRNQRVTVFVTAPALDGLDASSGSNAKATGVDASNFSTDASSGASVRIAGTCGSIVADASSGASLDASELKCERATADASSGASLKVYASESAVADASSGGSVRIYGNPSNVDEDESSGGSVSRVN